ncbi:unnamed protein product [Boreogadus saida]
MIMELVAEVKTLRIQNAEKDKRLNFLESRVQALEQYSRINDVIVSGLHIKPRSYARAVTAGNNGGASGVANGITLDCNTIEACHTLPRRINDSNDNSAVIPRLVNRKHKTALLSQGRKLKGSNVYLNEHLTKHYADIAKKVRHLRKQGKIQNTWTTSCKIFVKLNGMNAKVVLIRSMEELDKYQ